MISKKCRTIIIQRLLNILCICCMLIGCSITEPEQFVGAIRFQLVREQSSSVLMKQQEELSEVECTVWRGPNMIRHTYLYKKETVFSGNISGLTPDSTYAILLLGRANSNTVVARGYQSNIAVQVNTVTEVEIGWFSFQPHLISPLNGLTIEKSMLTLEWNLVNGAQIYKLKVDDDILFTSPEIYETELYQTRFMAIDSLIQDTYYWKVACQDSVGNTGRWSDIWSFTIE